MANNREFLMLAKTYDPDRHRVAGWHVSVKFDGQRCFWDGGVSRGLRKVQVPWANNARDGRYVDEPVATGLWSRYGNVIHAPDWFLDGLPRGLLLDGELYLTRGRFQETRRIISPLIPGKGWEKIKFMVFETPSTSELFVGAQIRNPNFEKLIDPDECRDFYEDRGFGWNENARMFCYKDWALGGGAHLISVVQRPLPNNETEARERLHQLLLRETEQGGEGLMLRAPSSFYDPRRSKFLLKVKPLLFDEGEVIGHTPGVGKLQGLMGALVVRWNQKEFQLSGFTDEERSMVDGVPSYYPPGCSVRFCYASLTDDGFPREARYYRR